MECEENKKRFLLNKLLIFLGITCLVLCTLIIWLCLDKTEISIFAQNADYIKENYASTEDTSSTNTWDISENGDGSVIATLDNNGVLTISGTGNMKDWKGVACSPWVNCVEKVKIENGITNIGDYAFSVCYTLRTIEISESVKSIGNDAFWLCGLLEIEIPYSVTNIKGSSPFSGCFNLERIIVDENNINYMDDKGVLYSKDGSTIIRYPETKMEKEYKILEGVTNIASCAFDRCEYLRSIEIPKSVSQIGDSPFRDCISLTSINVSKNNMFFADYDGVLYTKDGKEIIKYPQGRVDTEYAILKGTTIIGDEAFYNCTGLINIEIPESVINIGSGAFELCENLTNLELPDGVTSIGWRAFSDCRITNVYGENEIIEEPNILKRLKDPNDVLYAEYDIKLYNCTIENHEIKFIDKTIEATIEVGNGLTYNYCLDSNLWDLSKNGDGSVTAALSKDGTLTISGNGDMADFENDCSIIGLYGNLIKKVIIENGVTSIGSYAFGMNRRLMYLTEPKFGVWANCIKSIEIPSSVTSIGMAAFDACVSLASIKVDESNTIYKDEKGVLYTKDGSEILRYPRGKDETQYSIINGVEIIGYCAFSGSESLTSIEMPEGVLRIEPGAFYGCYSLNSIEIPSSVTSIGHSAFDGCESLTSIEIPNRVTSIGYYVFAGCESLEKIYIPESVIEICEGAFSCCDKVTIICYKESTAKTYAQEEGIKYLIIMDEINPKTTVEQLSKSIGSQEQNEIKDKNGEIITNTAYVTTGSTVQMSNGESYIIIVTGDADGDGQADIKDILSINKHRLKKASLALEYLLAADVNDDEKADIKDILQINKFRLGKIQTL